MTSSFSYVQTVHALVDTGAQGRLLQYIKTALRDPGYDGTQVFDRFYTVDELIALILRPLKVSAEQQLNRECRQVVLGRPVKFSPDPAVSDRAQEILYKAARLVGFEDIRFEMEPIGALYFYHRSSAQRELALIFDFGGGTLDLTLAEAGGTTPPNIIATLGVLVGGDDLDKRLLQYLLKYFGGMPRAGRRARTPLVDQLHARTAVDRGGSIGDAATLQGVLPRICSRHGEPGGKSIGGECGPYLHELPGCDQTTGLTVLLRSIKSRSCPTFPLTTDTTAHRSSRR